MMITSTKSILRNWSMRHPRLSQWIWFVALWVAGLLTVTVISYPLKWLVNTSL